MTIYREITAQNSCALKPNKVYITQREKIKDFHDLAEFTFRRRSRLWKSKMMSLHLNLVHLIKVNTLPVMRA